MEKQHLTYFKIENFKRFDSFEMSNLGQFNLIVGDNNVGKTSVLEALTFNTDPNQLANNFWWATATRNTYRFENAKITSENLQQTRFWNSVFKHSYLPIIITTKGLEINISIQLRSNSELSDEEKEFINNSIRTILPNEWLKVSKLDEFSRPTTFSMIAAYSEGVDPNVKNNFVDSYIPYIPANLGYNVDLLNFYYLYVNSDKTIRRNFENSLKLFVPELEEIRPHKISSEQEVLGIVLVNNNSIRPLSYFGDGTVKYTRFLLEMFLAQDRRFMVDEIGSGIHFTRLKDYWKTIIQLCTKYNVQLFATTHSLECQQAFIEALEDPEMQQYQKDARNISLIENKQGEVKAITYDFEQFEYALNIGFNTRGGKA